MKLVFSFVLLSLLFTGCFKTAEQIKREKMMDNMGSQIDQSGQLVANLTQQVNELQTKLNTFNGQIEELSHAQKMTLDERLNSITLNIQSLDEQVKALRMETDENKKHLGRLEKEMQENKNYIKKVNSTLSNISKGTKKKLTSVKEAHTAFEKSDMKKAQALYLDVLSENKINAAQRNHVWYNLGLINYNNKKYDDALVYFSKIYANYPKSSWAPRSLLYIARSLKNQKKTKESKGAYQELLKNFPNSSQAKDAKDEM